MTGSEAIQYFSPSPFMWSKCKFLFSFSVSQFRFQVLYSAQESVDIELIQKREVRKPCLSFIIGKKGDVMYT